MKKVLGLLTIAMVMMIFPVVASALEVSYSCETDYKNKLTSETGNKTASCDFYLESQAGRQAVTKVAGKITYKGVSIENIDKASSWNGSIDAATGSFAVTHTGATTKQKMFTITFKLLPGAVEPDCGEINLEGVTLSRKPADPETPVDPKDPVPSPETGSAVSYLAIATGVLLAGGAIYVATRRKKVFDI